MTRTHQIPAGIITSPNQTPGGFFCLGRHPDGNKLPDPQKTRETDRVTTIGLDPVPGCAHHRRPGMHIQTNPRTLRHPGASRKFGGAPPYRLGVATAAIGQRSAKKSFDFGQTICR